MHHFADLFRRAFHSFDCHIGSVRSDGLYPDSFFLSGCLEPLFRPQVPLPCIHLLPLSVSFILRHIPQSHNHSYIVSHDVLRLCVVCVFCMSYLVCDVFQDAWCVLSYFWQFSLHGCVALRNHQSKTSSFSFWCTASIYFIMMIGLFTWNTFKWCGSWL